MRWSRNPLIRLAQLREAREQLDALLADTVRECRVGTTDEARVVPVPWQAIGDALGISRAAAWERWRDLG